MDDKLDDKLKIKLSPAKITLQPPRINLTPKAPKPKKDFLNEYLRSTKSARS